MRECANLCHKRSRNLFYVANNLVAQNVRIPCRQKKRHSMWVLLRSGVFEISVLQTIRNASRTDPDFTQVNTVHHAVHHAAVAHHLAVLWDAGVLAVHLAALALPGVVKLRRLAFCHHCLALAFASSFALC